MREYGKILTVTIFSLCAAFLSEPSWAESLADWQTAEALTGCSSIPYGAERRKCMDAMVDVHDEAQWTCQNVAGTKNYLEAAEAIEKKMKEIESETKGLEKKVEDMKRDNKALEDKKKEVKEADKPAIEAIERQIREKNESIRAIETDISQRKESIRELSSRQVGQREFAAGAKRELELRIQEGQKTLAGRNTVQEQFKSAISRGEQESDAAIKAIAQKLVPRWKESTKKHEESVIAVTRGVTICQDKLAGKY
jgi:chromosome segregation ATPase